MPNETEGRIPLADLLVFHQLTRSLTSSFDLDTILRTILEQMEKMVEAEFWALLMLDESTKDLYYAIAAGEEQETLRGLRVKPGEGVAGWVLEHGETLLVPQMEGDPRAAQSATPGISSVRSVIAMPLRGRTGIQGVIEILNPRAEMSDYSIAFLHILADHAAIAIENAQDMARIQQLTITDDTTGLFNVRHLYDVLRRELKRSTKHKHPLSLAFWDLDRFKLVNDAHGHMIGSELLALAGRRLQKLCREQDFVLPLWRRRIRDPHARDPRRSGIGADERNARGTHGNAIRYEERPHSQSQRQCRTLLFSWRWHAHARDHRHRRRAHVCGEAQRPRPGPRCVSAVRSS